MESKQNGRRRTYKHPYVNAEASFRYLYCFGLGVMAMGNMRAIAELQNYYNRIIDEIPLSENQKEQIIVDINNHLEVRLTEVIQRVQRKEERYCFILDLYRLYNLSLWSQDYCRQILENYLQIFHFSEEEKAFFQDFNEAARQNNNDAAKELYQNFLRKGYVISYPALVHFFPNFSIESSYGSVTVAAGETLRIDRPTYIKGDVTVERGGSLLLYGTDLRMQGRIQVNGGRLRMRDAVVHMEGCSGNYWLQLYDTAVVQIEMSEIDLGLQCGFLSQNSGRLIMSTTRVLHAAKGRMVSFSGFSAKLSDCHFRHGRAGLLTVGDAARLRAEDCVFVDGEADYGGAVYSDSIGNVTFERCKFERCKAKYLGAAIYFKYQKFGQLVKNCACNGCTPQEDMIFHVYSDDFEMQIR